MGKHLLTHKKKGGAISAPKKHKKLKNPLTLPYGNSLPSEYLTPVVEGIAPIP